MKTMFKIPVLTLLLAIAGYPSARQDVNMTLADSTTGSTRRGWHPACAYPDSFRPADFAVALLSWPGLEILIQSMRRAFVTFVLYAAVCSLCFADDTALQPLDVRTRGILVFRECLVHLAAADLDAALQHIADGKGGSTFRINLKAPAFDEGENGEQKNVKAFIDKNFPRVGSMHDDFNEILFASSIKQPKAITIVDEADGSQRQGFLHSMVVKMPDAGPTELKLVVVGKFLYWVPFGW